MFSSSRPCLLPALIIAALLASAPAFAQDAPAPDPTDAPAPEASASDDAETEDDDQPEDADSDEPGADENTPDEDERAEPAPEADPDEDAENTGDDTGASPTEAPADDAPRVYDFESRDEPGQLTTTVPEPATLPPDGIDAPGVIDAEEDLEKSRVTYQAKSEYRVRSLQITPIELNGTTVRDIGWTEQRFRLDASTGLEGVGSVTVQLDALDGVLFGDNGRFLGNPSSNSGVSLATKRPNLTRWQIGLLPGGDPFDRESYGPVLTSAPLLEVNYLYADAMLPIGLLRVGRQPLNYGATVNAHDGGRHNRWGVSQYSDGVDRILFGTKLNEIVNTLRYGADHTPDTSLDRGVIMGMFYDFMKHDNIARTDDDLRQMGLNLQWLVDEADWFGLDWQGFQASATFVHLRNDRFNSRIYGFPLAFQTGVNNVDLRLQFSHLRGETTEISEGFAALTNAEVQTQQMRGYGAQGVVDVHLGPVTLTLEGNYASGDANPRAGDPITSFSFARDMNVGLLLFEHVLAFESARSVGVGLENLADADVDSFPLTEIQSDGRFSNAIAIFPQIYVDMLKTAEHNLYARAGVLAAWSATPDGVVDAVQTALNDVGGPIENSALNFHGGTPGRFYGTEVDLQLGYRLRDNFFWTVEGAVLFPGEALHDENGDAVRSFLVENRFELLF
ncbi:hypothetical protein FRC98_13970 [Lujinxingia vulgaris]|uniref:Alginate export domain-containing protein n=1 Tax=Lujinxingia vulgaris TaxID=2600176 RepID=A0A5C6XAH1_9DELT|nr:hypothetical protein [Lujinxingia vulgaris]TXD36225.1 hypothetical protein FRC98_13970 [Lujinxingia vulgaris]